MNEPEDFLLALIILAFLCIVLFVGISIGESNVIDQVTDSCFRDKAFIYEHRKYECSVTDEWVE